MCESHEALKVSMNYMKEDIKTIKKDVKDLTKTMTTFIENTVKTNITRTEAEEKFTLKTSFRVGISVIWAIATLIWILFVFLK